MIFEYRSADGQVLEIEGPPDGKRPIGHRVRRKGVVFTRQPSMIGTVVGKDGCFESVGAPRYWGCQKVEGGFAPRYGPDGKPRFASMGEVREAVAKANAHGEHAAWNP